MNYHSKSTKWLTGLIISLLLCLFVAGPIQKSAAEQQKETKEQHDQRMGWWRAARFGMFIHWGLYAVPAGTWDGKPVNGAGEWIMNSAKIPVADYETLTKKFNPVKFNAHEWVTLAKEAGMKYIVITTKHHDGFCLFNSVMTDYDIMSTPFKRDIMKELADECHKQGIKICWYHSIMDWHNPDYLPRRPWDNRPTDKASLDHYIDYMKGQLKELLTNYGEIGVIWFDGGWEHSPEELHSEEVVNLIRSIQPKIIINDRIRIPQDFNTPEQYIPATGFPGRDWESCMTMNDTWGYKANDNNWKSAQTLIRNLVNCSSKGGNYLLNVGPTAEGLIPQASVERLKTIGQWIDKNGESVYGTSASPFKKLSWGRCTQKSGKLYLHVFTWPEGSLTVPGLKNSVKKVYLLADPQKTFKTTREGDNLQIAVPAKAPDDNDTVIVLEIDGTPNVIMVPIRPGRDGSIQLTAVDADIHGKHAQVENKSHSSANVGYWTNVEDYVSWDFETSTAGDYQISIEYACPEDSAGSEVDIIIADQTIKKKIENTGSWNEPKSFDIGKIQLPKGKLTLTVKPITKPKLAVMNLFQLVVKPVK